LGNYSDSSTESKAAYMERRLTPRYSFVAITELKDFATSRKVSGSVEEISRKGCYVNTMNVLPMGTALNVRISRGRETLVTNGEVIYLVERRGMGVLFVDTPADQMKILDSWLAERSSIVAVI